MTKKEIAIILSKLKLFEKPSINLEQYPTDSEVAADLIWTAYMKGDVEGKIIADLGCGTGILGIGCLLLGAKKVYFVDKDQNALNIALENIRSLKGRFDGQAEVCHEDVTLFNDSVDAVIMNPPFGTKTEHADKIFLEKALNLTKKIYSLHKASTKPFIDRLIKLNDRLFEYKEYDFPIKNTMQHHSKRIERIKVGLWIIE